ncbi:hypothetical protein QWU11_46685, partial [Actinomadura sp. DC4]|nr:hypothetical protein [Actinomadura sp. DC4]
MRAVALTGARSRYGLGLLTAALHRWAALAVVVTCWEIGAREAGSAFYPPPSRIVVRMYHLWFSGPVSHVFLTGQATGDVLPSLARMAVGLALSVVEVGEHPLGPAERQACAHPGDH